MTMDYTSITGGTVPELTQAMTQLVAYAEGEKDMATRLGKAVQMWQNSADEVTNTAVLFMGATRKVRESWTGRTDAPLFDDATNNSLSSMATAAAKMGNSTSGPSGGSTPWQALQAAAAQIPITQNAVKEQQRQFDAALAAFNASFGTRVVPKGGSINISPTQADLAALVATLRPIVQAAGVSLNQLGAAYDVAAAAVQSGSTGLKWVGPKAGDANADDSGNAATGPAARGGVTGSAGSVTGSAGGVGGAAGGGDGAAGSTAAGGDAGAGGGTAGSAQGGAAGAGGSQGGATGGAPAGSGTGGTGLSGVGTLPPPTIAPSGLPTQPNTNLSNHPQTGLPLVPITSNGRDNLPVAKATTGTGTGRFTPFPLSGGGKGGGGGVGGGGIGSGGLGDAKTGTGTGGSNLDRQIPQAGKPMTATPPTGTGQAPAMPTGGTTAAGQPSGPGGAGAPPPMMPPVGMAGAGAGGRGGRPGAGTVRPGGPGRSRPTGPTPGVPASLRGRSGKSEDRGGFPMLPPASASKVQRRHGDEVETLQLLDEELWTVEGGATASATSNQAPQQRRLAR
jgi:hypothetical protein